MRTVELGDLTMPAIGLGTFKLQGEQAREIVQRALAEGYRHIDTARMYGNEAEVGAALAASGVPRGEIFLTTKVWPDDFRPRDFERAVTDSLHKLRTDHIDLLLLHWPSGTGPVGETLSALGELVRQGKVRHAGLSNFTRALWDEADGVSPVPLVCNQVEYHPFLDQRAMVRFLAERRAALTAYCPLARGRVVGNPAITRIADKHGVGEGEIALAWLLSSHNVAAVPKTANPDRLASNLRAAEIELSPEDIAAITALAEPDGRIISPGGLAPEWD